MAEEANASLDSHLDFLLKDLNENTDNFGGLKKRFQESTSNYKSDCDETSVVLCSQQSYEYPLTQSHVIDKQPQQDDSKVSTPLIHSSPLSDLKEILEKTYPSESEGEFDSNGKCDLKKETFIRNLLSNNFPQCSEKWQRGCSSQATNSKDKKEISLLPFSSSWPKCATDTLGSDYRSTTSCCPEHHKKFICPVSGDGTHTKVSPIETCTNQAKSNLTSKSSKVIWEDFLGNQNTPIFNSPELQNAVTETHNENQSIESKTYPSPHSPSDLFSSHFTSAANSPTKTSLQLPNGCKQLEANLNQKSKTGENNVYIEKQELQISLTIKSQSESLSYLEHECNVNQENLSITQIPHPSNIEIKVMPPINEFDNEKALPHGSFTEYVCNKDSVENIIDSEKNDSLKLYEQVGTHVVEKSHQFSSHSQKMYINQTNLSDVTKPIEHASTTQITTQPIDLHALSHKDLTNSCESMINMSKHHQSNSQMHDFKQKRELYNDREESIYAFGQRCDQSPERRKQGQEGPQIKNKLSDITQLSSLNWQEMEVEQQENQPISDKIVGFQQTHVCEPSNAYRLEPVTVAQLHSNCQTYEIKQKFEAGTDQDTKSVTDQDCLQTSNKNELENFINFIDREKPNNLQNYQKPPNLPTTKSTCHVYPVDQESQILDISERILEESSNLIEGEYERPRINQDQVDTQKGIKQSKSADATGKEQNKELHASIFAEQANEADNLRAPEIVNSAYQQSETPLFDGRKDNEATNNKVLKFPISYKIYSSPTDMFEERINIHLSDQEQKSLQSIQEQADLIDNKISQQNSPTFQESSQISEIQHRPQIFVYQQQKQPTETYVQKQEDPKVIQKLLLDTVNNNEQSMLLPCHSPGKAKIVMNNQHVFDLNLQEISMNSGEYYDKNQELISFGQDHYQSPEIRIFEISLPFCSEEPKIQKDCHKGNYLQSTSTKMVEDYLSCEQKVLQQSRSQIDEKAVECGDKVYQTITSSPQLQEIPPERKEETLSDKSFNDSQFLGRVSDDQRNFEYKDSQSDQEQPENDSYSDKAQLNRQVDKILEKNQQEKESHSLVNNHSQEDKAISSSSKKEPFAQERESLRQEAQNACLDFCKSPGFPTSLSMRDDVDDGIQNAPFENLSTGMVEKYKLKSAQTCKKDTQKISKKHQDTLDLQIVPISNTASHPHMPQVISSLGVAVDKNLQNMFANQHTCYYRPTLLLNHERSREIETDNGPTFSVSKPLLETSNELPPDQHVIEEDLQQKTVDITFQESPQQAFSKSKDFQSKPCNVNVEVYVCSKETKNPVQIEQSQNYNAPSTLFNHSQPSNLTRSSDEVIYPSMKCVQMQTNKQILHFQTKELFGCHAIETENNDDIITINTDDQFGELEIQNYKSQTSLDVSTGGSPHKVVPNEQVQVCLQEISKENFQMNTGHQQETKKSEDHMVPENFILTEAEWKDVSLYQEIKKADKLLSETARKRSFQWNDVYEATLLQASKASDLESQSLSELGLLHPQQQIQRPLRLGLSKRQKVKSLHDK